MKNIEKLEVLAKIIDGHDALRKQYVAQLVTLMDSESYDLIGQFRDAREKCATTEERLKVVESQLDATIYMLIAFAKGMVGR
jgi:tRNA U55 pseudouridine synthase TruB